MKANSALRQGDFLDAIAFFQEYLAENPDSVKAAEKLGYAYLKAGKFQLAIEQLEQVRTQNPDSSLAALYLGQAYLKTDDVERALDAWRPFNDDTETPAGKEIKRLLTLLEIANAKKSAAAAVQGEQTLGTVTAKPNSYAIFYFDDLSPQKELRSVQKALASMVIADLAQIDSISVVERVRLQALLDEMALAQTGLIDTGSAPQAGRLLGAEKLVVGSLNPADTLRVSASTASTAESKVLNSFALEEKMEQFFVIEKEIVYNIINSNEIKLTPAEKAIIDRYHTKNLKAFSLYGQGLDALDSGNWSAAKDFFDKAYALDPNFMLAKDGSDSSPAVAMSVQAISVASISAAVSESIDAATEATAEAESAEAAGAAGGGEGGDGGGGH